jgi:hypothetical protein
MLAGTPIPDVVSRLAAVASGSTSRRDFWVEYSMRSQARIVTSRLLRFGVSAAFLHGHDWQRKTVLISRGPPGTNFSAIPFRSRSLERS